MPPSYAEWKQRSGESVGTVHPTSTDTALRMIQSAAVSFEHLTGDTNWDKYLSILQDLLNVATKERDRYKEVGMYSYSDSAIREAQCKYHEFNAQVQLLQHIMGLPYEIRNLYEGIKSKEVKS